MINIKVNNSQQNPSLINTLKQEKHRSSFNESKWNNDLPNISREAKKVPVKMIGNMRIMMTAVISPLTCS